MKVVGYQVVDEQVIGKGGFLTLRRLRLRLRRDDGSLSEEGLYDFVERPMGLDAGVLALYQRVAGGRIDVLLRDGLRVPMDFGRVQSRDVVPRPFTEVVAGILEAGEVGPEALRKRAAAEAYEEAGLRIAPDSVELLGAPMHPTPGMCPELFYFAAAQVSAAERSGACVPPTDGSPFEEGATLRWLDLDDALAACAAGTITDMKTELVLRRLKARI